MFVVLTVSFAGEVNGQDGAFSPVTMECVQQAGMHYDIPMPIIVSILDVEGGKIGTKFKNLNGTTDLGPALINSQWLAKVKQYGLTETQVRNNGCKNIMLLTWILANYMQESQSIWQAVGRFHSSNIEKQQAYALDVYDSFTSMHDTSRYDGAKQILARANTLK